MAMRIKVEGMDKLLNSTKLWGKAFDQEANRIISSVAADGRKNTTHYGSLKMGQRYEKKWSLRNGWHKPAGTTWNAQTGVWQGRRPNSSKPLRMINFTLKSSRGAGGLSQAQATVSSPIANLWENHAYYNKSSGSLWSLGGQRGGWPRGIRQARPWFFTELGSNIQSAIPRQIAKAEQRLVANMNK